MEKFFFLYLLLHFAVIIRSETIISGIVADENRSPLIGANVYIKNTITGGITDNKGHFHFLFKTEDSKGTIIVCSFMGYEKKEIKADFRKDSIYIQFMLSPKEILEKEITVTVSSYISGDQEGVTLNTLEVLKTPGAAADVFRAVQTYPGIQRPDEGAGLFVRGGDISETVILLDGAVIHHPYRYESPTGGYFGMFSPFLLEGTFFSSGGYSSQYGNAMSGALSMKSRDIPPQFSLTAGSGLAAQSILMSAPLFQEKGGFNLSGNYSQTKTMFQLNGQSHQFTTPPESYDLNCSFLFSPDKNSLIKLFLFQEEDRVGVRMNHPQYQSPYYGKTKNQLTHFYYQKNTSSSLIKSGYCYSYGEINNQMGVLDLSTIQKEHQFYFEWDYHLNKQNSILSGIKHFSGKTSFRGTVPYEDDDLNPLGETFFLETGFPLEMKVFFTEWNSHFFQPFLIVTGWRMEYSDTYSLSFNEPRISAVYSFNSDSKFSLAAGIFHQFPDPMYLNPYKGNPDLSPSKAYHMIWGYEYCKNQFMFRGELYYKKYKNLITIDEQNDYTNQGKGYSKGMDIFIKNQNQRISYRLSYSFLDTKRKWKDSKESARPEFYIPHQFNLIFNYQITPVLLIGGSFLFSSGKPYTSSKELYHDKHLPAYHKADLTLSYLYPLFQNKLSVLYISLSNIYNRKNILGYRFSDDYREKAPINSSSPRSLYFGISLKLL